MAYGSRYWKNVQFMKQEWTIVSNVNVLEWQTVVDTGKICTFCSGNVK